ncbi:MAG: hypothetical protein Q7J58_09415 [Hydrogenophaga sp.]|uniref:hypothetical protein n=1 Tax=Hydrogenophaga sp. TaxID=1904254 RepID=UPI0027213242|nr:hypothetical protein [Hydrogenophaga sp.]MDO9569585.1 hypothetical protein [Hydrogenophaga sp.]
MNALNFVKLLAIAPVFFLGGCATSVWEAKWGADKPHISYVSLEAGQTQPDKLYVWNPNNNAAYIFQKLDSSTAACVSSADVAKARNYENEFKVDLGKVLDKIDSAKIEEKLKVIDTVTKLSEKGESASFLNVSMFHICMMAGSGKITPTEANALMSKAIDKAAEIAKPTK